MRIKKKFQETTRPLTKEEEDHLRASIEEVGVLDPIVLWDDVIVDGHNRRRIANKLGMPDEELPTIQMDFSSDEEAIEWILKNQLARRNLSPADFKLYLGRLYNQAKKPQKPPVSSRYQNDTTEPEPKRTREKMAEEHGVSEATVHRASKTAEAYDKLTKPAQTLYDQGKLTDSQVKKLAGKTPDEQNQVARKVRTGQATAKDVLDAKPVDQVKHNRQLAHQYRDKLARAICDYHEVKPNRKERDRLVKVVQGVQLW